jgi:hypothetical protein
MGNNFGIPVRNNTSAAYGGLTTQPSSAPLPTATAPIPTTTNTFLVPEASVPQSPVASGFQMSTTIVPGVSVQRTGTATVFIDRTIPPTVYQTENLTVQFGGANNPETRNIINEGLSALRPEVLLQFSPRNLIDTNNQLTDLGKLADFNYKLRKLKLDVSLVTSRSLSESETVKFEQLDLSYRQQYETCFNNIQSKKIKSQKKKTIKALFDIKSIPDSYFGDGFLSFKQIFSNYLGYSNQSYNSFTDTKILGQLILDLRNALENYSSNLLSIRDLDRTNDLNPYTYDKTFNVNGLKIEQLRSNSRIKNLFNEGVFRNLVTRLPPQPLDKIKLMIHLLSKELLVSKNLSNSQTRTKLVQMFGASANPDGNPFDNIFGDTGVSIFDPVVSATNNSIVSLLNYVNQKVLPFENRYLQEQTTNSVFIPGHEYFLDTTDRINLDVFTIGLSRNITELTDILTKLLSLDVNPQTSNVVFSSLAIQFGQTLAGRNTNNISHALFKLASEDIQLQYLLFNYLFLAGLIITLGEEDNVFIRSYKKDTQRTEIDVDTLYEEIGLVITRIVERVVGLLSSNSNNELNIVNSSFTSLITTLGLTRVYTQDLTQTLRGFVNADPINSKNSLFKMFIDFILELENINSSNGTKIFLLQDDSGRTRFNFLSSSTMLFLFYQTMIGLSAMFIPYEFAGPVINNSFNIEFDTSEFERLHNLLTNRTNPVPEYTAIFNVLEKETTFVKQGLNCFNKLNSRFSNIQQLAEPYFLQSSFVTEYQTKLALSVINSGRFKNKFDGSYGILPVTLAEKQTVIDFSKNFGENNFKVFGIGLPNGFVENLNKNIIITEDAGSDQETSVIKINVFCKLLQYPNIVLKPQSYLFDLNIFNLKQISTGFYNSVDQVINNNFGTTYVDGNFSIIEGYNDILIQKEELRNHKTSELLKTYMCLVSGIKMYEEEFFITPKLFTNKTKDNLFNSLDVRNLTSVLTGQKLFDRILFLLVDLNQFEIDYSKTNKNSLGAQTLEKIKIVNDRTSFDKNDLVLVDIFFTVGK